MSRIRLRKSISHLLIANPENRRVKLFQAALKAINLPQAKVVSYESLLTDPAALQGGLGDLLSPDARAAKLVKIESPGENFAVEKRLIGLGASIQNQKSAASGLERSTAKISSATSKSGAHRMRIDVGRLRYSNQWALGFGKLLGKIETEIATFNRDLKARNPDNPSVQFYNSPTDIRLMFDKSACQEKLERSDVPVPPIVASVESFSELERRMSDEKIRRVFVKLKSGSSGSGVIALWKDGDALRAVTTMELVRSRGTAKIYNNLKMKTYTERSKIEFLVDFIFSEGGHVEHWLPKAILDGRSLDLRIVLIGGRAQHVVVRTSRSPLTNLHLGNRRGDVETVREKMGAKRWKETLAVAESASVVVPDSHIVGVDLLLKPGFRDPTIIELNAFGDLLPNVLFQNRDTYTAQIKTKIKEIVGQ